MAFSRSFSQVGRDVQLRDVKEDDDDTEIDEKEVRFNLLLSCGMFSRKWQQVVNGTNVPLTVPPSAWQLMIPLIPTWYIIVLDL